MVLNKVYLLTILVLFYVNTLSYSLNWVYQTGVTLLKDPHYSLFVPSNNYMNNAIRRIRTNYPVKSYTFKVNKILERNFHHEYANTEMGQIYVVNNFVNFLNFLPYKWRKKCTYNFCKYKEFENIGNLFNCIRISKHEGPILLFQGKLKKQYWIHLPLKYEIVKNGEEDSLCTLTFTPLHKYYSDYTIEIKLVKEKENNNVTFITSVKCANKNNGNGNSFYINVIQNIAMFLAYDIFEGINNNIHVVHRRNANYRKTTFNTSNVTLKRKKKTNFQFVLSPVINPWSFKIRRS
ncbi:putative Selenoprotein [Plasmodium knowlesi]|uniref:Putative Selenoprotein n=1 Tax=Plasmodium knowlesi TaxID=5850 RepID=A0A1Y3DLA6_PLAKN|nr:putative Selenoprotein [Plasmodium knowlesi]